MADDLPEGMTDAGKEPEPLKVPPPLQLVKERQPDELEPAFSEITRVTMGDMPQLGWLVDRLTKRFPHVHRLTWGTRLHSYMLDNSYFFMRTPKAVLLATVVREPFAEKPYVWPMFLFETERGPEGGHIHDSGSEKDAFQLVRELMRWGKHQGAGEIRRLCEASDVPPSRFQTVLRAEKRDEVVLRIK